MFITNAYATPNTEVNPDPLEKFNRAMFCFNENLDKYILKPIANLYSKVVPKPIKQGVHNFFCNIGNLPTIANDILQLHLYQTLSDSWRFAINTTIGIGGLFDVASNMGFREEVDGNAIAAAKKPNWDQFLKTYAHTLISGSGTCVGLPPGQMGNSEVGHLNMGAGRIVHQDLMRINLAIENGDFFQNKILLAALEQAKQDGKQVHIMGLLSPGGVHAHENHIHALVTLAGKKNISQLYIHAFLDGRDTPPRSALPSLQKLESLCEQINCGQIVSIIGRYFAMDRDKRWERIQPAYELLVQGKAAYSANTVTAALKQAYARGESDEFVSATTIHEEGKSAPTINDGDVVIFMNFRSDRARELTESLIDPNFHHFQREQFPKLGAFVGLSEYDKRFAAPTAYPPQTLNNILAEIVSKQGMRQLRIAETEKYAHVTFFFNGGIEQPFPGEDRILIPSPRVATYDLKPEMSAPELTERLIAEIKSNKYDLIICNFANPDMVGHSGDFTATVKAIEVLDGCLGRIVEALIAVGGEAIITADHGNAEQMYDYVTLQPHTAHTNDPVPFIFIGRKAEAAKSGKLSDISPTLLYLLNLQKPAEMTGKSLLKLV